MSNRGLARVLSVTLAATAIGLFASACGGDQHSSSGSSPEASKRLEQIEDGAIQKYHWYLEEDASSLVDWTTQLRGQIVAGEVSKAQSRYATSRVQYGQLEPAASLFPALELRVNGQAAEQPEGSFKGFHRIELELFRSETTKGLKAVAKTVLDDVGKLHHEIKVIELQPDQVAKSAKKTLEAISAKKVTGREEPYSHIDMVDVSASTEGAEAAFEAVRPLLIGQAPELVESIESRFLDVYSALAPTGTPARQPQSRAPAAGAIFINYSDLPKADIDKVAKSVRPLVKLFDQVEDLVAEQRAE